MNSEEKKYNLIEFVYVDNGQMFGSGAHLTEAEVMKLGTILDRYAEAGVVDQAEVRIPSEPVQQDFDGVVDELLKTLKNELSGDESQCQNCDRIWPTEILTPLEQVKNLLSRVAPGEPLPSGECPACGALCQPVKE